MSQRIVVIGGGHNGLTAAALLAKAGRDVLVVEARQVLGGLAAPEPFHEGYTLPGLLHSSAGVRPFVVDELKLESFGLRRRPRPDIFSPGSEGGGLWIRGDSVEGDGLAEGDREAYAAWRKFIEDVRPVVARVMDSPPLDLRGSLWQLLRTGWGLRRLGARTMTELLRVAPMCVADWMRDTFQTEQLQAALSHGALEGSFSGPWAAHSAANLLVRECMASQDVVGGGPALIDALARSAEANGAVIRTGNPVAAIRLDHDGVLGVTLADGEAIDAPIVCSTIDPKKTFFDLIGPLTLPLSLARAIKVVRARATTAKVHLALSAPLVNRRGEVVGALRTGSTLDEVERSWDAAKYREMPASPALDVLVPSVADPELCPDGHAVVSIMAHAAPSDLEGGWSTAQRDRLGDLVINALARHCPGVTEHIVDVEVMTPIDIAERYRLSTGHVHHGEHAPDQMIFMRPTIACGHYATPFPGLFLGGSGSHPGGGLTCGPGALAATAIHRSTKRRV